MYSNLWLGSQNSLDKLEASLAKYNARDNAASSATGAGLLSMQGDVGVITISGSLADGTYGQMGQYFGITGYGDIQDALVQALQDKQVKSILLDINSGGGTVSGVQDTSKMISAVGRIKPVVSVTSGSMGSAALWLGSSASKIYAGETAITGSLGVIMVHSEKSAALASDGVKVTVIRAGEFKALGSPYEPLSDVAKSGLQAQANYLADIFLTHVAESRGVSKTLADSKFGQGREFIGAQGVEVGLIDAVGSFADALTYAQSMTKMSARDNKTKVSCSSGSQPAAIAHNTPNSSGEPMKFTPEQLAAMAAGVDLDAEAPQEAVAEAATPAADPLSEMTSKVEALTAQVASLQSELTAANAVVQPLADIVRAGVKSMTVGLGGAAATIAEIPVTELAVQHKAVSSIFTSKFKAGAVASTSKTPAEDKAVKAEANINPLFLSAVSFSKPR